MKWSIVPSGSETDPCCCAPPAECCMYPADGLGVDYTAADLPDELSVTFGPYSGEIFTKSGTAPTYYEATFDSTAFRISTSGGVWSVEYYDDYTDQWFPAFEESPCLITGDGNLTPGDDLVEDQFADCYQVEWDDDGTQSANVTRDSLCQWSGTDDREQPVILLYSNVSTKWVVQVIRGREGDEFFPDNRTKDSNQSAPDAGDGYYGGFTVTPCL
jgi:hypothetical protein